MRGRLARSETIQSVLPQTLSDERQAAVNTTTCLDRDQILDLCELIHTSHSGNLPVAGSRVLGLFRCIQIHFVDAQTQSHPGVAGRHPHSFPIHHLTSGGGLHPVDRRGPPSPGARRGRFSTQIRQYIIDSTPGVLLVMARAPLGCTQESTTRQG